MKSETAAKASPTSTAVEVRPTEPSFSIFKKIFPAPQRKGILQRKGSGGRTAVVVTEAGGGAPVGITTNANAYAEVQSHHALRALDSLSFLETSSSKGHNVTASTK